MFRNMTRRFCRAGLLALAALAFIASGTPAQAQTAVGVTQLGQPLFREYKGVTLGMTADQVHSKLGAPKETAVGQDFYSPSETELVQVLYDSAHKVRLIAVTYLGETITPTCRQIFGEEVTPEADGSINKIVRYPGAAYSVTYYRTAGTDPLVTVSMQKYRE